MCAANRDLPLVVFNRLGTSPEGAHLRARMQSACLLSDMEAFKAANPGCCLGDFVRWYSPRDWITGDDEENVEATGDDTSKDSQKSKGKFTFAKCIQVCLLLLAVCLIVMH